MNLYLVRHGESLSSEIDPNQPLSKKGVEETEAVAEFLKPAHLTIDEIAHSEKLRAKQTAEILQKALAPKLELHEKKHLKPMDPVEPIAQEVAAETRSLMLVGHLPFMEKLLSILVLGKEDKSLVNFCGSCVVCLQKENHLWRIAWVVSPNISRLQKSI